VKLANAGSRKKIGKKMTQEITQREFVKNSVLGLGRRETSVSVGGNTMKTVKTIVTMLLMSLVIEAMAFGGEVGFTSIFNGKDLTGWEGEPGYWSVEDGAITGTTTTEKPLSHATYLFWRGGRPGDFELRATFRIEGSPGNSGINFRSTELPNWEVRGYQADMETGPNYSGILFECDQRGFMAQRGQKVSIDENGKRKVAVIPNLPDYQKLVKPNDWNEYAIVAHGSEIILSINGVVTCHVTDREKGKASDSGLITLQLHPGPPMKVQFKNIRIKHLGVTMCAIAGKLLAGEQPKRPRDFKPMQYPQPDELKNQHSERIMQRASQLMRRVEKVNEEGKYKPNWKSLDKHKAPEWFLDAKFGMFIDWSIYSVPECPPLNGYTNWSLYRMLYGNADDKAYFANIWGNDFRRDDFITLFTAKKWDAERLAQLAAEAGMKYVVPFSKHHTGYCQWPSTFTFRNCVDLPPHRDLTKPLVDACRKRGLKFGLYFSQDEWEYPVIDDKEQIVVRGWSCPASGAYTDEKWSRTMTGKVPVRDFFDQYINPQLVEAIDLYDPDILWLDGDWYIHAVQRKFLPVVAYFFNHAQAKNQEVVINDRLGQTRRFDGCGPGSAPNPRADAHGDFYASEVGYRPGAEVNVGNYPWEENIGISRGFGYDWRDTEKDLKSPQYLVHMLIDVAANGGNLLLAVGPDASGKLGDDYIHRLREIGKWLGVNGQGIYATRAWTQFKQGSLRFTRSKDGKYVYVFCLEWPGRQLRVKNLAAVEGSNIDLLGHEGALRWSQSGSVLVIDIPELLAANRPCEYAWVFKVEAQRAM